MSEYTAEDFARANLATWGDYGVARRADPSGTDPWHAYDAGQGWFSDEEMAEQGWTPVVESRTTEHTLRDTQEKALAKIQRLADRVAEQGRVILRKSDEIEKLRDELVDLYAEASPRRTVTFEQPEAAWAWGEVAEECAVGDVMIAKTATGYSVYRAAASGTTGEDERILSRAPKREPWQDLADDLDREKTLGVELAEDIAQSLYDRGWRKGGEES